MLWQTIPLRQRMLGELWKYFGKPLSFTFLHLFLVLSERIIRLLFWLENEESTDSLIWNDTLYNIFYYARMIEYPIFFAIFIDGGIVICIILTNTRYII